jgi:phosphoribosylaminoimidazole-succinocarboxamide synthase
MSTITETNFSFPYKTTLYRGKVRDVYNIDNEVLVLVATDRISAFDHVLPRPIPYKGQVLNQTAAFFLRNTADVCNNHLLATPDENVTIGLRCDAYPIELVVRGYLCGHAWRVYKEGRRELCGVPLPNGLRENDPFPEPIITPSTKSTIGHDMDISEADILRASLLNGDELAEIKYYALGLFARGQEMARKQGLILADTKYEFGHRDGKIFLIDEVHTPDSSRYFYADGFDQRQARAEKQEQLSKEFVREWLMAHHFQGLEGQTMPAMPDEFVHSVSSRYIGLYERVTGQAFKPRPAWDAEQVQATIAAALQQVGV